MASFGSKIRIRAPSFGAVLIGCHFGGIPHTPKLVLRYIPSVIHCAPSHYSFLPPYLPNSRLCAGGANVPFLERHGSDPPRLARLGRAQKQDRPGPLCGTPRSAGGFASADPFRSVLLHALQESDSRLCRELAGLELLQSEVSISELNPAPSGAFCFPVSCGLSPCRPKRTRRDPYTGKGNSEGEVGGSD